MIIQWDGCNFFSPFLARSRSIVESRVALKSMIRIISPIIDIRAVAEIALRWCSSTPNAFLNDAVNSCIHEDHHQRGEEGKDPRYDRRLSDSFVVLHPQSGISQP